MLNIENAILKTETTHQSEIRTLIVNELQKNRRTQKVNNSPTIKVLTNIKKKLIDNNAIITKADKGNTIVIINQLDYNTKIDEYILNNNIATIRNDLTKAFTKSINHMINQSNNLLNKYTIYKCKMIKPSAPILTGLPKIHKPDIPIRPLINFTTSPCYKIAKYLNKWLNNHIQLENNRSIKNNLELTSKISSVVIPNGAKLASFDITNMYSNIPVADTINITQNLLKKNKVNNAQINEAIELLKIITKQNYFQNNNKYYNQKDGLPMGSPLSGTLADIYLNHFENTYVLNNTNKYNSNIVYWHRYVDDILLLFKGTNRQLDMLHNHINNAHHNIKFTLEKEQNNAINFLDLTITNFKQNHTFKIYRKPTQTNHTIHNMSNHPQQQKMAAYNHLLHRLNKIPMSQTDYNEEYNTIVHIAEANGYNNIMIDRINKSIKNKLQQILHTTLLHINEPEKKKYIPIEYNEHTSKVIHKIFKTYGYSTAYKTVNQIKRILKPKQVDECYSGIYKLVCNDCSCFYVGQTGRNFQKRFTEHIQELTNTHTTTIFKSNYAQHLHNEKHTYTDFDTNLKILHKYNKGDMMDRMEEYEIYKHRHNPLLINEKINTKTNKIYELIYSQSFKPN